MQTYPISAQLEEGKHWVQPGESVLLQRGGDQEGVSDPFSLPGGEGGEEGEGEGADRQALQEGYGEVGYMRRLIRRASGRGRTSDRGY